MLYFLGNERENIYMDNESISGLDEDTMLVVLEMSILDVSHQDVDIREELSLALKEKVIILFRSNFIQLDTDCIIDLLVKQNCVGVLWLELR